MDPKIGLKSTNNSARFPVTAAIYITSNDITRYYKAKIRFLRQNDEQASGSGIKERSAVYSAFVLYYLNVMQGSEGFVAVLYV